MLSGALAVTAGGLLAACGGNGGEAKIAFVRYFGTAPGDVYVMNADGSGQRRLTRNPADDSDPAWSPDGRSIAFATTRDGNSEIYVMNADGSGQRRLTRDPGEDAFPAWS